MSGEYETERRGRPPMIPIKYVMPGKEPYSEEQKD
jgi:hypothetical protein